MWGMTIALAIVSLTGHVKMGSAADIRVSLSRWSLGLGSIGWWARLSPVLVSGQAMAKAMKGTDS